MVLIERRTLSRCKFYSKNKKHEEAVKDILKLYVDGAFFSELYKKGLWDGFVRFYDKNDYFDFGIIDELIFNLELQDIKWKYVDYYETYRHRISDKDILKLLHPHQKSAVKSFFEDNIGIIIVPTRGGKTFIACETIRKTLNHDKNAKILFVVDTVDLFNQSVKEISEYLKIKESDIGYINDKGVSEKQINVAMIQSVTSALYSKPRKNSKPETKKLKRQKKLQVQKVLRDTTFLIVDEIQEFSSEKRMNAMKKCKKANQVLGLSATPFKQIDGNIENLKIKGFFGGICYEIPDETLQKRGHLALDKIILIHYDHKNNIRKNRLYLIENYQEYLSEVIHKNVERNKILYNLIEICRKHRWKTLVLFNSKKHGYEIAKLTNQNFISGDTKTAERDKAKEKFLRGRGKILLASNIWKKGITLPEAEVLILGDGGLEGSAVIQKRGRVLGAVEGKKFALIIDIMDINAKYFAEHSLNRLEVYNEKVDEKRIEVYMRDEFELLTESAKEWLDETERS